MFVDLIYAIVTFPEIYPILGVLLFVVLAAMVTMLCIIPPIFDKRQRNGKRQR